MPRTHSTRHPVPTDQSRPPLGLWRDQHIRWGERSDAVTAADIGRLDLVRRRPELVDRLCGKEARMSLEDYRPMRVRADVWDEVGPFVRDAAVSAAPLTAYTAHLLAARLTRYVVWATRAQGMTLDARGVFRRAVIIRYIDETEARGELKPGTLRNDRTILLRVAEVLAPDLNPKRLRGLNARVAHPPYSPTDIDRITWWMRGQGTPLRERKATTMASLCLGAGLKSGEVADVRRRDVSVDEYGIVITVGGERQRQVPMLRKWEPPFRQLIESMEEDEFVFGVPTRAGNRNLLSNFVEKSDGRTHIHPRSDRMRATWLVDHLTAGTSMSALMRAGGIERFENLIRYLQFVPALDEGEYRRQLRGASS